MSVVGYFENCRLSHIIGTYFLWTLLRLISTLVGGVLLHLEVAGTVDAVGQRAGDVLRGDA